VSDLWATVAAERGALAGDLANLTPAQWDTPSLCPGWTVRDIVAHLSATASLNPATFFLNMAKAGFNFDKFANGQIAKHRGADPGATLAEFRGLQNSTSAPPGPKTSWLGEVVVHGDADSSKVIGRRIEDIALPEGTTLGAVVRGEDVIIAHHDTTVQPDDHLILFLTDRRHIEAVEKLFQGSASFL